MIVGGSLCDEDAYVAQKFAREALRYEQRRPPPRTRHERRCARHSRSHLRRCARCRRRRARRFDVREELPVLFLRLRIAATKRGLRTVIVHPREIELTEYSDVFVQPLPGTEACARARRSREGHEGFVRREERSRSSRPPDVHPRRRRRLAFGCRERGCTFRLAASPRRGVRRAGSGCTPRAASRVEARNAIRDWTPPACFEPRPMEICTRCGSSGPTLSPTFPNPDWDRPHWRRFRSSSSRTSSGRRSSSTPTSCCRARPSSSATER